MPSTSAFSSEALAREILASAAFMERRFYRSFLKGVDTLTSDPELMALLIEIQRGAYMALTPGVEQKISRIKISSTDLADISRQAYARAGRITNAKVDIGIAFDITNPRAVATARTVGGELIRNITRTTRQNIRDIISEIIDGELSVVAGKKLIRQQVGLLPRHAKAVRTYRRTLINNGTPIVRADTMADTYAKRLLKVRADTIARTEIARATSLGQQEAWEQMLDADMIPPNTLRMWITADIERACDICGPMNGTTAPMAGFWDTMSGALRYPTDSHPNCRCTTGLVFPDAVGKSDPLGLELWLLSKRGDFAGHPFRGNQWTGGIYHGDEGKLPHRRGKKSLQLASEFPSADPEDFVYSSALGSQAKAGKLAYLEPANGSFYSAITSKSRLIANQQMLKAFSTATGVQISQKMETSGARGMSSETLAETLDAIAFLIEEWDDGEGTFKPDILNYVVGAEYVAAIYHDSSAPGTIHLNLSSLYFSKNMSSDRDSNGDPIPRDEHFRNLQARESSDVGKEKEPHSAPSDISAHQATIVHEFGHIVKTRMEWRDPNWLYITESGMIDHMLNNFSGPEVRPRTDAEKAIAQNDQQAQDFWMNDINRFTGQTRVEDFVLNRERQIRWPRRHETPFGIANMKAFLWYRPIISDYATVNGQEFFAEMFTLAYANRLADLPAINASEMVFYTDRTGMVYPLTETGALMKPPDIKTFKRSDALKSIRDEFMSYMDDYAGTW